MEAAVGNINKHGFGEAWRRSQGEDFFLNHDAQDTERGKKRESECYGSGNGWGDWGRGKQFEIPILGAFDPGVELTVRCLGPILQNPQAERSHAFVYAQRLGAIALQQLGYTLRHSYCQLAGTGHRFGLQTLHVGGTFDRCRWRTLRLTKCMGGVEVSAETSEFAKPRQGRSDYCGGNNGGTSWRGSWIWAATTVLRQDELVYLSRLPVAWWKDWLQIFISRSSLLMLVSALIGRQRLLGCIRSDRFWLSLYSFGDAMLILPEARKIKSASD